MKTVRETIDNFILEMLRNFNDSPCEMVLSQKLANRLVSEVWLQKENNTEKSLYPTGPFSMYGPGGIIKINICENHPDTNQLPKPNKSSSK